jgi:hypothetical protein
LVSQIEKEFGEITPQKKQFLFVLVSAPLAFWVLFHTSLDMPIQVIFEYWIILFVTFCVYQIVNHAIIKSKAQLALLLVACNLIIFLILIAKSASFISKTP